MWDDMWDYSFRQFINSCNIIEIVEYIGAPGEIRTPDRLVRSQVLYPAELRARGEGREVSGGGEADVNRTGAGGRPGWPVWRPVRPKGGAERCRSRR